MDSSLAKTRRSTRFADRLAARRAAAVIEAVTSSEEIRTPRLGARRAAMLREGAAKLLEMPRQTQSGLLEETTVRGNQSYLFEDWALPGY
mmetsp:Transcript_12204/g.22889  ORF Transcript_12204/g.22889 Transcript_12204/m.22889 type:complete len:90 (+) Transcript_12204:1098-1367(+)